MAARLTLEQEVSQLEQIIEACRLRLTRREEIQYLKGVYYAPAETSFTIDANKLFPDCHLTPLADVVGGLKFERISGSEYRVSLI